MTTTALAVQALNADSERWKEISSSLGAGATNVGGLNVSASEFPSRGSLDTLYANLSDKVIDLLIAGRNEAREIADELEHVKQVITSADEVAKENIEQFWDYTF